MYDVAVSLFKSPERRSLDARSARIFNLSPVKFFGRLYPAVIRHGKLAIGERGAFVLENSQQAGTFPVVGLL